MKKTKKSIMALSAILLISGCSSKTIDEERTIILEIDSDVIPQFTTNFGQGSYDTISNKYTHTISSIKDLYITLSYDDLKTVTVHVPTSEMLEKTIVKQVSFGQELDAEVEITVNGVKTLEGITFTDNNDISNIKIGEKNKFKFDVPSRDKDYNIKFQLPGYKEFNVDIDKESIINGFANLNTVAMTNNQISVGIDGVDYSYKIYSYTTNNLVASGRRYTDSLSREYVLLDNDQDYYMEVNDYNSNQYMKIYKINSNEDKVIKLTASRRNHIGYIALKYNGTDYPMSYMLYNKNTKTLSYDSLYNSISEYGLIVKSYENKWIYFDNITDAICKPDRNTYDYELDFTKGTEVDFYVTRIHNFTSSIISSEIEENFNIHEQIEEITFNNNRFEVTIFTNETSSIDIDLYDYLGNKIKTITKYIYSNFYDDIVSGTIDYNGRKVPYQFPLLKEDIIYENGEFSTNIKPVVDIQKSLIEFLFVNSNGSSDSLNGSSYIVDSHGVTILKTDIGNGRTYFQLEENESYTLYADNKKYEFILNPDDIHNGQFIIADENLNIVKFKAPENYTIELSKANGFYTSMNDNGIVKYYTTEEQGNVEICINNGDATICISKDFNINEIVELGYFYVLINDEYQNKYDLEYVFAGRSDFKYYYYFDTLEDALSKQINLEHVSNGESEYVALKETDFIYDQYINAYVFDFSKNVDYVLTGTIDILTFDDYYKTYNTYYLKGTNKIIYNGTEYDLSNYNSKYLYISTHTGQDNNTILDITELSD